MNSVTPGLSLGLVIPCFNWALALHLSILFKGGLKPIKSNFSIKVYLPDNRDYKIKQTFIS